MVDVKFNGKNVEAGNRLNLELNISGKELRPGEIYSVWKS